MKRTKEITALGRSLGNLNQLFNHRSRMGIMAVLMVDEWVDFVGLRDVLNLTDGSLASHLKTLAKEGLLEIDKRFVNNKPKTSYRATTEGRRAFRAHLAELEKFVKLTDLDN